MRHRCNSARWMNLSIKSQEGFRSLPNAELLEIFTDFTASLGVAYQRCLVFEKPDHALERTVICFPRGVTRAASKIAKNGRVLINDASNVVIKAAGLVHSVKSLTTVYDDLALLPSPELIEQIAKDANLGAETALHFRGFSGEVPRTPWLNELVEQYFQRRVARREPARRLTFFEHEILRELLLLVNQQKRIGDGDRAKSFDSVNQPLSKAIGFLESNLFNEVPAETLASHCGASISTLNRIFRAHLKLTPAAYQRERRLEEAYRLLHSESKTPVEQVAALVGYESPSAFSRSYRRKFGNSPRGHG